MNDDGRLLFRTRQGSSDTVRAMQHLTRSRGVFVGVTLLCLAAAAMSLTMTAMPARASLLPRADNPSVPILGHAALKNNSETGHPAAVATLHGVRRIPGGTVIYFSIGFPASARDAHPYLPSLDRFSPAYSRSSDLTSFARNMLVDPAGRKVYTSLIPAGDTSMLNGGSDCICSDSHGLTDARGGQARVLYQVVAPLPASVQFVDVFISGQVIWHVKVGAGVMTPAVDPSKPILVGMGWPRVDQSAVASSVQPATSIIDLTTSVADLEQTVTTRSTPKQISVALASDVLFETDMATLSPKASAVLQQAAADVKAAGGTGSLEVVGYTDNTGSTSHNMDLSQRRAIAVAAAIKPLLPVGVQLLTSGKGEDDPVAPNTTAEGRGLNRRVSIVFAPQAGAK